MSVFNAVEEYACDKHGDQHRAAFQYRIVVLTGEAIVGCAKRVHLGKVVRVDRRNPTDGSTLPPIFLNAAHIVTAQLVEDGE